MNKVEKFTIIGDLPEGYKSVGFYIEQNLIEEVGKGCKLAWDLEDCLLNASVVTANDLDKNGMYREPQEGDTEWKHAYHHTSFQDIHVLFGESLEVPEGWEVYFISIQPEEEIKVLYSVVNKETSKVAWFVPQQNN